MNSYIETNPDLTPVLTIMKDKSLVAELIVGKGKVYISQLQFKDFIDNEPVLKKFLLDILR